MFSRSRVASLLDVGSSVAGNNMRTVHLLLAATAAVVTCKPQRSNNDIIWYPVDDEEGVFISIYGEKRRSSSPPTYRSHRRARFSGEQDGPYRTYRDDRTEYQDTPSFYNGGEGRRPFPQLPPSFQYEPNNPYPNNPFMNNRYPNNQNFNNPYPNDRYSNNQNYNNPYSNDRYPNNPNNQFIRPAFNGRPQNEVKDEAKFQEILNEVFELDKKFPREYTKEGPATGNQWGPQNAQLIERPAHSQQIEERPKIPIRPLRPSPKRPGRKRPSKPFGTTTESDAVVFPDQIPSRRPRPVATERPPLSPCERMCPVTPEFNPICGSDSVTYSNSGRLKCAQMCGKDVVLKHYGNCGKSRLVTPPLSDNPRKRRRGNRTRH